jgi:uncharacterized phage-associated protein
VTKFAANKDKLPDSRGAAMYEARKICNLLIAHNNTHLFELTNLRINKLLYFIHGWGLTSRREGLVRNHFLAWTHGPVIRPVFDAFKTYGEATITEPAKYFDYVSGEDRPVAHADISPADTEIVMRIFASFDRFTTRQLVEMSHEPGGPWDIVYKAWSKDNRCNLRIPNELMRTHFLKQAGGQVRH